MKNDDIPYWKALVRAAAPGIAFIPFALLLPMTPPEGGFFALAWYQKLVSLSTLPVIVWTMYRFVVTHERYDKTPEERILDE